MLAEKNLEIVLLPGLDGTGSLLCDLESHLSVSRPVRVIAYPLEEALGYAELTELVAARLPSEPFVLLGESFSGPIAIETAVREKSRVAGLVLASTFARYPVPAALAWVVTLLNARWIPRAMIEGALLGSHGTPEVRSKLAHVLSTIPNQVVRKRTSEALRVDKRHLLGEIACPVLCLAGLRDRIVWANSSRELSAQLPKCAVCRLDAPHMLLETHALEAAEAIDRFCGRVLSGRCG